MRSRSNVINTFRQLKLYKKIPNNFLLVGLDVELKNVVERLAQIIVCPQNNNCSSHCIFCKQIIQGSYENFLIINPSENSIKIDDLEPLFTWSKYLHDGSQPRIYWIRSLETMTKAASNKLLKFLESKHSNCVGILSANNLQKLLPTIRSRLQVFYHYEKKWNPIDYQERLNLSEDEIDFLKDLNEDVYFIDDNFISEQFLPVLKMVYFFWNSWEKKELDNLYLWDRTKEIENYFWFFLEVLLLFLKKKWWEQKINQKNNLFDLYWLLTFSQKIWNRQQNFALSISKGGNKTAAFLFWLSALIEKQEKK